MGIIVNFSPQSSHGSSPSPLEDLLLQPLSSNFSLQHPPHALLPRLFQRLDLAVHALLLRPPQRLDLLVLLAHVGQVRLDALEHVLELRVAHQPRVLAKLLQQPQLRQAPLDILGARVRLL